MKENLSTLFEQMARLPEFPEIDLQDIVPALGFFALGAYGLYRYHTDNKRLSETEVGISGADPVALEVAKNTEIDRKQHKKSVRGAALMAGGMLFFGAHQLDPIVLKDEINPEGSVAIVVDASHSMRFTADSESGKTRLEEAYAAILESMEQLDEGQTTPPIIVATDTNEFVISADSSVEYIGNNLNSNATRPNDTANLAGAVDLAHNLLSHTGVKDAEIIMMTDGTISDAEKLSEVIATLPSGYNVTPIITGTSEGEYNLSGIPGAEVEASVTTSIDGLEETIAVNSKQEISERINKSISETTITPQKKPWQGFKNFAIAFFVASGLKTLVGENNQALRPTGRS